MDSRPPTLLLLLLLAGLLHLSSRARGQESYIIDSVGLTILPSSTVESGTAVTIHCKVSVSSDNIPHLTHTFQLKRDDVPIYTTTTPKDTVAYELNPARAADSGSYECRVTVRDKSKSSFSQKLNVTGLQTPILYLSKRTLYKGDDFVATCSAPDEKGSLIFRFFQRFRSEEPQKMKQVAPTGNTSETTLVLRVVGDYFLYCNYEINLVSETRRSNSSAEIQVMVTELQISPIMNVLPSPNVFEGDLIEVVCKVVNSPPNIELFLTKDRRILRKDSASFSHRFRVQEGDSGELVCKAESGNVQKETYQVITVKELFSKPRLTAEPLEIFEGDRLKLTCSVTVYVPERISNKTPSFAIYKDNVKVTPSKTYITVAHPSKNGNYTCKALGSSAEHSFVKESPTIVVRAKVPVAKPVLSVVGGTLVLGKPFQLLCHSGSGTLPIRYTMHGPGGLIGERVVSKPGEQALFNISAVFKSFDLSKFICHAKNSQSKPPTVGSTQLLHSTTVIEPVSKPLFSIKPSMGDVSEGQDMTLTCSVQRGSPPITFTWYHTGSGDTLDSLTSNEQTGSIVIRGVEREHQGEYGCKSSNPANQTKLSNAVTVKVRLARWKKGLIAGVCIVLTLALVLVVALKTRLLVCVRRRRTDALSGKSAGTKVERLSLTQAEANEAANVTPGIMGKSVWSEHVSGSESDDQISESATEPQYTEVKIRGADPHRAPVKRDTDTVYSEVRTSRQGVPEQTDAGSVEYAELNHDTDHHGDGGLHEDHVDAPVQPDHADAIDDRVDSDAADQGE